MVECDVSLQRLDLGVQIGLVKVKGGIESAEWMVLKQDLGCRSFGWVAEIGQRLVLDRGIVGRSLGRGERMTHIVKQSQSNPMAFGLMVSDTSSGIGGA